jgi:hypothetical protein
MVEEVLADPKTAATHLKGPNGPAYVGDVEVRLATAHLVILNVSLLPYAAMAAESYPVESVDIWFVSDGAFVTPPTDDNRTWEHRYPRNRSGFAPLCLWYPDDPETMRWTFDQPIEDFVGIVSRHVQAEEYLRRNGTWPMEDVPHGSKGRLPFQTAAMWRASKRRKR